MTNDVEFSYSRTYPTDVECAFDEVLPYDLAKLFNRRYAAIPPIKSLRDHGAWDFEPAGTGVRSTWSWIVRPADRLGTLAVPVFRRMWQGYERHGFDNIEGLLVR